MKLLSDNIKKVFDNISNVCNRCNRDFNDITIVAVTKTVDIDVANELIKNKVKNLGENRVQEFLRKYDTIGDEAIWHLIGHLQTNKVKYITGKVNLIHSVDSIKLLNVLSEKFKNENLTADLLIQLNTSNEESKFGISDEKELYNLIETALDLTNIKISGLMTMAPFVDDEVIIRNTFRKTFEYSEKLKNRYDKLDLKYFSYGMSNDYEIAIEEGANILRIGSAFFEGLGK